MSENKQSIVWKTPQGLFDAWKNLNEHIKSADRTILQLLTHPEATDEQILEVVKLRGASNRKFLETTYNLSVLLEKKNRHYLLERMHYILGVTQISQPEWVKNAKKEAKIGQPEPPQTPDTICEGKDSTDVMTRAHALCPSDLPHLEKMRWITEYYETNRPQEPEKSNKPNTTGPKL